MHDFENRLFYTKHGIIKLSRIENNFLDLLIKNKGHIVKYKEIMKRLYRSREKKELRNEIAAHAHRLRKKLKNEVSINSLQDVGYWIE